jgi:hypothetical protein
MSSNAYRILKDKRVPQRYRLSRNIKLLLEALDSFTAGKIDAAELGHRVRIHPKQRSAISNTIKKCAVMMVKKPEEGKTCVELIKMCTEILDIAGLCVDKATSSSQADTIF